MTFKALLIKYHFKGKNVALDRDKITIEELEKEILKDIEDNWLDIEKYETKTGAFIKLKETFYKAYYLNS